MGIFIPSTGTSEGGSGGITEVEWSDLTAITNFQGLVNDVAINALAIANHDHDANYRPITWVPDWGDVTSKPDLALASHDHDNLYKPIGYAPTWGEVTGKPNVSIEGHTHDWGDLPATNDRTFTHSEIQKFTHYPAIEIESSSPTISLFDNTDGSRFWIHANNGNFYLLNNLDESSGWISPHPLIANRINHRFTVWGEDVWHTGNFNPAGYWRKDELLKFNKRANLSGGIDGVPFLRVDFTSTNGVAAYYIDAFYWDGTPNNYSMLNRQGGWFLIENRNIQAEPRHLLEDFYPTFNGLSVTLTYYPHGRNNLVITGERCWGYNWAGHTVL